MSLEGVQDGAEPAGRRGTRGLTGFLSSHRAGNVAILLLALVGVYFFVFREMRFFLVPSTSMEPTLLQGDQIVTLNGTEYVRGDIVVVDDPEYAGEYLVKRITGVGGDTLSVRDGALFINGAYASEPYIREPMIYSIDEPVSVPEGSYFLMGDNRNQSEDSSTNLEMWTGDQIIGRVVFIYYPYHRLGKVSGYPLTNLRGE